MRVWQGLNARFMAPAPAERLATVRFLVGVYALIYLLVRAPVLADFRRAPGPFRPVGLAAWLDAPIAPSLAFVLYGAALIAGVGFTLGLRFRISGPLFALATLWVTSYRNSWGMIFHNENMVVVHLIVLAGSDAGAALSLDARGHVPGAEPRFGWPLRLCSAASVLAYMLAGIAKLKVTGVSWMDGDVLRNYIAYDAMRKSQIGSFHSPLAGYLVQVAWPYVVLSILTLALELLGPLALLSRRLTWVWVLGLWGFHVGVFLSMAIAFPYQLSGVAFASMFEAEKLWQVRRLGRLHRWLLRTGSAAPNPQGGPSV
ncbi:MAG: HTTM domain-containing protein [Polyangiales bacterium]